MIHYLTLNKQCSEVTNQRLLKVFQCEGQAHFLPLLTFCHKAVAPSHAIKQHCLKMRAKYES